jgi:hypothetical protein
MLQALTPSHHVNHIIAMVAVKQIMMSAQQLLTVPPSYIAINAVLHLLKVIHQCLSLFASYPHSYFP